jgi:hypothetical protein
MTAAASRAATAAERAATAAESQARTARQALTTARAATVIAATALSRRRRRGRDPPSARRAPFSGRQTRAGAREHGTSAAPMDLTFLVADGLVQSRRRGRNAPARTRAKQATWRCGVSLCGMTSLIKPARWWSTRAHNVHWTMRSGPQVLINENWYKPS